jgi:hypothetical protein
MVYVPVPHEGHHPAPGTGAAADGLPDGDRRGTPAADLGDRARNATTDRATWSRRGPDTCSGLGANVSPVSRWRDFLKRTLPTPVVDWIRRWVATVRYVRYMSLEVFKLRSRLETGASSGSLESPLADPFFQLIVREVLDRTDVVLQQLDRKIEGQGARDAERLHALEDQLAALRRTVQELRDAVEGRVAERAAEGIASGMGEVRPSRHSEERQGLPTSD